MIPKPRASAVVFIALLGTAMPFAAATEQPQKSKAAKPGRIVGTLVHADTRAPIGGADVLLLQVGDTKPDGKTALLMWVHDGKLPRTTTNEKGQFAYERVPAGEYALEVLLGKYIGGYQYKGKLGQSTKDEGFLSLVLKDGDQMDLGTIPVDVPKKP